MSILIAQGICGRTIIKLEFLQFERRQYQQASSNRMKGVLGGDFQEEQYNNYGRERSNSLNNSVDLTIAAGKPALLPPGRLNSSLPLQQSPAQLSPIKRPQSNIKQNYDDYNGSENALNRNLPGAISQERLQKFSAGGPTQAGLQDRAILHDLDSKFDNQDRMINFILQQISNLEGQVTQSTNIVRNNVDIDRDSIIKLKSEIRGVNDQSALTNSNLNQRLSSLEAEVQREITLRTDLQQKL